MKRLVLVGGGHAHVQVLASLAAAPLAGWQVDLVTPHRRQVYSGMLAGWIAGHYPLDACTVAVADLAQRAKIGLDLTQVSGVELARQEVRCADGTTLPFDLLSINTGPEPACAQLPGAAEHAIGVRPIAAFVAAWPALLERMLAARSFAAVIIGAGAAGVELAFAIRHSVDAGGGTAVRIILVGTDDLPLRGAPERTRRHALALLQRRGIEWLGGRRALRVESGTVRLAGDVAMRCDACILATGAAAPAWPAAAGLATDDNGYLRVDATLRSVSHANVFAAGDVAAYHADRPKSGVFAVRAGPVLAANLRAAAQERALQPWSPQRQALYIVGTGGGHALAWRGSWSIAGNWVWHWKERIDRRFVQRYSC